MSKINNNLIGLFAILAFVLGPIGASNAFARTVYVRTGAVFYPTIYPTNTTTSTTNTATNNTNQNTTQTNTNSSTSNTQNTTNTDTRNTNTVNASNTRTITTRNLDVNNRVSEVFVTSNYGKNRAIDFSSIANNMPSVSEVNTEYGRLTASAVTGSNGFWPTGIAQWILVFIILIIMITLFRYMRRSKEVYMAAPAKYA